MNDNKKVLANVKQSLSDSEKIQARANIDAAWASTVNSLVTTVNSIGQKVSGIETGLHSKQDILTPGNGIIISNDNEISGRNFAIAARWTKELSADEYSINPNPDSTSAFTSYYSSDNRISLAIQSGATNRIVIFSDSGFRYNMTAELRMGVELGSISASIPNWMKICCACTADKVYQSILGWNKVEIYSNIASNSRITTGNIWLTEKLPSGTKLSFDLRINGEIL